MENYILILFSLIAGFLLSIKILKLNNKIKTLSLKNQDIELKLKKDIDETLELSTSDQLIKELRKRNNMPFVLLLPIKEKDYNGITIESHGINQASCFAILHLAKAITAHNFRKNGIDPPKLPPLNDYFE